MHPTAMAKHEMGQASISERGSGRDVIAGRYRLDEMLLIEVLYQVKRRGSTSQLSFLIRVFSQII